MIARGSLLCLLAALPVVAAGAVVHTRALSIRAEELRILNEQISTREASLDLAASTAASRSGLDAERRALDVAIPSSEDLSDLLAALVADLKALTEDDRSIATIASSRDGDLCSIPILVSFRCPFASVFELLCRIESYPRLVALRKAVIASDPGSSGEVVLVSARLETYALAGDGEWP